MVVSFKFHLMLLALINLFIARMQQIIRYIGMSDHTTCTASICDGSADCRLGYWSRDVLINFSNKTSFIFFHFMLAIKFDLIRNIPTHNSFLFCYIYTEI